MDAGAWGCSQLQTTSGVSTRRRRLSKDVKTGEDVEDVLRVLMEDSVKSSSGCVEREVPWEMREDRRALLRTPLRLICACKRNVGPVSTLVGCGCLSTPGHPGADVLGVGRKVDVTRIVDTVKRERVKQTENGVLLIVHDSCMGPEGRMAYCGREDRRWRSN